MDSLEEYLTTKVCGIYFDDFKRQIFNYCERPAIPVVFGAHNIEAIITSPAQNEFAKKFYIHIYNNIEAMDRDEGLNLKELLALMDDFAKKHPKLNGAELSGYEQAHGGIMLALNEGGALQRKDRSLVDKLLNASHQRTIKHLSMRVSKDYPLHEALAYHLALEIWEQDSRKDKTPGPSDVLAKGRQSLVRTDLLAAVDDAFTKSGDIPKRNTRKKEDS